MAFHAESVSRRGKSVLRTRLERRLAKPRSHTRRPSSSDTPKMGGRANRPPSKAVVAAVHGLCEVLEQVVDVLKPDRDANQPVGKAAREPLRPRDHRVCHGRRVLDERLGPAQRDGEGDHLQPLAHAGRAAQRRVIVAGDDESEHSPKGLLPPRHTSRAAAREDLLGELVVGVRREAWVEGRCDERVGVEHLGDAHRVLPMPLHAHVERAQAAREEEGLKGCERRSKELLHLGDGVSKLGRVGGDGAGEDVGVTANVLSGRVYRHVHAGVLEAALVEGRGKGPVAHDPWARVACSRVLVNNGGHRLQVSEPARGVCGRLGVHDARVGLERRGVGGGIGRVDKRILDAPVARKLDEELVRATVDSIGEDAVVARLAHSHERGGDGRHAGGEEHAAALGVGADSLERRELPGRAFVRGRAPPAVHISVAICIHRLALFVQPRAMLCVIELIG
mmetsp:Transcript_27514/g.59211  ORF Transcript_27514/g.59211 Transcript_27514/m.59211 type:complete len:450 (-) Transcript_27514:345-1694(-)